MAKCAFVSVYRPRRRITVEVQRQGPLRFAIERAGDQSDVWRDFQPADVRPRRRREQSLFRRAEGERDRRANSGAFGFTGVCVQAGRDVDRQNGNLGLIDFVYKPDPGSFQRAVQPDAKQSIDNQGRAQRQVRIELFERRPRIGDIQQCHLVVRQGLARLARIVAVVAFAGQDDDPIARPRELFGSRSDNVPDAADDLCRRALGRPGGLLPFPHLGNADNRGWH